MFKDRQPKGVEKPLMISKILKWKMQEVKLSGSCLQMLLLRCLGCAAHALGTARVVKSLPAPNWKGV